MNIVVAGVVVRLLLVFWLSQYETAQHLTLTDIDYKVYSEAAQHILNGESPYQRHTYRYTPLLAQMLTVNQFGFSCGKYLFVLFDAIAMVLLAKIFRRGAAPVVWYALNPILIYITVRGSCESIGCCLMFLLALLQQRRRLFLVGVVYGFWVHLRVYPIIFALPFLLYFGRKEIKASAVFLAGCAIGFLPIVLYYYQQYRWEFLHETYLYHLTRTDNRHNLSAYFYWTYLTHGQPKNYLHELLKALPQLYLYCWIVARYYRNYRLVMFLLTAMFVIFNKVLTVQYYMWVFASFALVINASVYVQERRWRGLLHMFALWLLGVLTWVWTA